MVGAVSPRVLVKKTIQVFAMPWDACLNLIAIEYQLLNVQRQPIHITKHWQILRQRHLAEVLQS